ncbi:ribonuclease H-like domain-containing protein, partial [Tanacetum coccineum]
IHLRKELFSAWRFGKLKPRGYGPFRVLKKINDNAYKIKLPGHYNVSATFNVADLSPYKGDSDGEPDSGSSLLQEGEDDAGLLDPQTSSPSTTRHKRLSHPEEDVLCRLESSRLISCNKSKLSALCRACQLGKHVKLPFYSSESTVTSVFEIIHSDLWTSPLSSESEIKYYSIFLDHFSHFVWVYLLRKKSDLFDAFVSFCAYVNNQFNIDIKALQCDHRGEYDNTRFHDLFRQNDIQFRFSFPHTSQQNGKSERMLRTINNIILTLLFQAHLPLSYWVEDLNMAAQLLNILPFTAINNEIPFAKLYKQTPTYDHLRVFGCLCYPHVDVTHKLQLRSTRCIFLSYPANHRGYRCLDMSTNKIIISRHVRFDEDVFLFGTERPSTPPTYDFIFPIAASQPTVAPPPTQPVIPPSHNLLPEPTISPTTPYNSPSHQTQHSLQPHSPAFNDLLELEPTNWQAQAEPEQKIMLV